MKACARATCQILPPGIASCGPVECPFFMAVNPKYEKYDVVFEIKTFFIQQKEII
jgi:hypothetical protein